MCLQFLATFDTVKPRFQIKVRQLIKLPGPKIKMIVHGLKLTHAATWSNEMQILHNNPEHVFLNGTFDYLLNDMVRVILSFIFKGLFHSK